VSKQGQVSKQDPVSKQGQVSKQDTVSKQDPVSTGDQVHRLQSRSSALADTGAGRSPRWLAALACARVLWVEGGFRPGSRA
jgi:hypothetical protein